MRRMTLASPGGRQRLSLLLIAVSALLAGAGAFVRATESPGSSTHSSGYFFDVAGWLLACAAAIVEARVSDIFFQFSERKQKRRALSLTLVGILCALIGCYFASLLVGRDSPTVLAALANAAMVGGVGAGLAGIFSLGWFYGGNYAAKRVEKLSEEEW